MVGIRKTDEGKLSTSQGRQNASRATFRAQSKMHPSTQALRPLRGLRTWAEVCKPFGPQTQSSIVYLR